MKNLFGIVVLILLSVMTSVAQCSDADKKALEAFDRAWGDAGVRGDKTALMTIYADDYIGLPDMENKTTAIGGTMADFEWGKANPGSLPTSTHEHYMITCTPGSALITHRNTISTQMGPGGRPGTVYSRSVHTLEKRNGKWQVVSNALHGLDDAMTIEYLEQDWNTANLKRDKDWFEKNYAPDFVSVSSTSGKVAGKKQDITETVGDKGTIDLTETSNMQINVD
ncbi:MAG: nuclear transport factor 2 family protein, partial [bacterium]|nr:nuclear transport factor 2 family protein [bacterium]